MKTMRFCMTAVLLLFSLMGWAQEKLFDKYSDMKEVKSVYISKTMLDMNTNVFMSDLYIGKARNLNSVRLLSTMDNKVRKSMAEDIRSLVKSSKYELLMKQKGLTSKSEFYVSRRGGKVKELIMVMDGAASLKFVYLEGDMTDQDVKQILLYQETSYNTHQIPGLENLQALRTLKGLDSLKELESLKDLQKYFDGDTWKQFREQMQDLGKQLKDWDMEFVR